MPLPLNQQDLQMITHKVYALYAKHGFDGISMDEVSRQTGISKATLYRYFSSKEDIVRSMVHFLIEHLDSVQFSVAESIQDVVSELQDFYVKSVLVAALSGSRFLLDLEHKFPDSYRISRAAMTAMQNRFETFFHRSVEQGFFRDLPFPLVSRQFAVMLPTVIDMNYLDRNQLTLPEALRAYDRMFLCQILSEDSLFAAERSEVYDFADDLADILMRDFFIDSIRR